MGLAASQARFLGITARKSACELRSMEIAQERLSVSNQLSQASQNYMTSLNATKLIWNPDRTDDFIYQMSYETLSRPSAFNDFNLQLLTNVKGQTVLDTSFYDALMRDANGNPVQFKDINGDNKTFDQLSNGGIERSEANFKKFIKALNDQGIINNAYMQEMMSAMKYADSHSDANAYLPDNGFGTNLANIGDVYSTDLMGLCEYVDDFTIFSENDENGYLKSLYETYGSNALAPTPYDMANEVYGYLTFDDFLSKVYDLNNPNDSLKGISVVMNATTPQPAEYYIKGALQGGGDFTHYYHAHGHGDSTETLENLPDWSIADDFKFNLADLLGTSDVALVGYSTRLYFKDLVTERYYDKWGSDTSEEQNFINSIDKFVDNLENLAKYFFEFDGGEDAAALERTRSVIESLYKTASGKLRTIDGDFEYVDSDDLGEASTHTETDTYAGGLPDYLNYCIPVKQSSIDKTDYDNDVLDLNNNNHESVYLTQTTTAYSLSLSNLAQAFFTEYENQRSQGTSGYNVATSTGYVGDSNLVTMDQHYVYDYIDAGTANPSGEITQILNYFSQMFNQICVKGYTVNPAVEDPTKLQNMIKNGSLMVSTIADDNYFYQYDYQAYSIRDGYFMEVADEDAITAAEAEYKVKQAQLNAKEEELSVDMQNVEAELAALTTEYDTVKNLINKSVQKDFTTCGG